MSKREVCCSSPASMCYWLVASLGAWVLLSLVGLYWQPLHRASASTVLLAAGIGCVANWKKHRTFHCGITGPLLLSAGAVLLLSDAGILHVRAWLIWLCVVAGTAGAFLLESRYAHRS